ncbi:MAG TPA: GNAT family N-acetyltransferase [Chitinophagales bacterium]|nr:GNAT family N-acetyltransferase [Chitinophagales bacterium]
MLSLNFTPFPVLTTERLVLRQLEASDAPALSELRSIESVNLYVDRPKTLSVGEAQARIETLNNYLDTGSAINWVICLKGNSQLIGTVCFFNFNNQHNSAELGYELHPHHQGKGIMAEAIAAVIDYAVNTMQVQMLEAVIHPDNEKSLNLARRFKFVRNEAAKERIGQADLKGLHVYTMSLP